MICRNFYKILRYLVVILLVTLGHAVEFRTSNTQPTKEFYVAIDFKVPNGSHITAPIGIGKPIAPSIKLTNCKILDIRYPKAEPILKFDGTASEYMGFYNDFTVVLKLSVEDITKPVDYDIFCVICNHGCKPSQYKGQLQYNGKFTPPIEQPLEKRHIPQPKPTLVNSEQPSTKVSSVSSPVPVIKQPLRASPTSPDQHTKTENATLVQHNLSTSHGILYSILIGLLGGLLLNVMPCVFPVISIKLLSVAKSAGQSPRLIRCQCVAYSMGTICMFLTLGLVIRFVRTKIPSAGWGFYMQFPQFNYVLLILFLLCALHFLEIYQFHFPLPQVRWLRSQKGSICIKSFGNGIFGAITSAVCVGPFLGLPIGNALLSGNIGDAVVLFVSIGVGLASPFLFMALFPQYISKFPKLSERALRTFSLILGTLMLLSCAWLISVLSTQLNHSLKLMWIIATLVLCAILLYVLQNNITSKLVRSTIISAVSVIGISGYIIVSPQTLFGNTKIIEWHDYNGILPNRRPLFLSFTANWCLNCQFNNRVFTDTDIIKLFNDKDIYAVKCDWTNRNDEIATLLSKFGSVSVPLYVYYPKTGNPIVLPTMLTKTNLMSYIKEQDNK